MVWVNQLTEFRQPLDDLTQPDYSLHGSSY